MNGALPSTPGDADRWTVRLALALVGLVAIILTVTIAVSAWRHQDTDAAVVALAGTALGYIAGSLAKVTGHGAGTVMTPMAAVEQPMPVQVVQPAGEPVPVVDTAAPKPKSKE